MSLFIEGVAFPLGRLNKNGWGVPFSEAGDAISSLKNSVIRICSRISGHACDLSEDPFSEIGRIMDAWQDGNEIRALGLITDSDAAKKIEDGTWEPTWSVFAYGDVGPGGFVENLEVRSMTLVRNPAWEEATWQIVAASVDIASKRALRLPASRFIFSKTGGMNIPENDPKNNDPKKDPDINAQFAELQEKNKKLAEDLKRLVAENEEMKKLAAEKARQVAASMPVDEVQKLIAEEATKIANEKVAAYEEERKRVAALEKLTAARSKLGVKTEPANYANMRSVDIEKLVADFEGIQAAAGKNVHLEYPTGASGSPKVGRYNSKTKQWE